MARLEVRQWCVRNEVQSVQNVELVIKYELN